LKRIGALAVLLLAGCSTGSLDAPPVTAALVGKGRDANELTIGRNTFVSRCIECHTLPRIREHDPAEWPHIVDKMAGRASLTPAEHQAVTAYILAVRAQK
jgi:mono/diheme cytochrome c family protein